MTLPGKGLILTYAKYITRFMKSSLLTAHHSAPTVSSIQNAQLYSTQESNPTHLMKQIISMTKGSAHAQLLLQMNKWSLTKELVKQPRVLVRDTLNPDNTYQQTLGPIHVLYTSIT